MACSCGPGTSCHAHVPLSSDFDCCDAQRSDECMRTLRAHFHVGTWSKRADKQTQGQLSVKPPNCHRQGERKSGWTPPSPSLHSFPSSLPSYHQPSSLLNHYNLDNSLCPVKASRQTCTKTRSHLASPPNIQTCTHAPPRLLPIKNPSVTQSPSREREGRWRKWEEKVSHFITFCFLTSPCLGDNTKRDKKDLEKSTWEGDSKGKWSSYWKRGGYRKLSFLHFLTEHVEQRPRQDTALGWRFFTLGLPPMPPPQSSKVNPPVTPPQLFSITLSALIVADWLNGWKLKWRGRGGKKWKKRRSVRIWEKRMAGLEDTPSFFSWDNWLFDPNKQSVSTERSGKRRRRAYV